VTPAIEKILAQFNTLTAAERRQLRELLDQEQPGPASSWRSSLVDQVKGRYSFVPTSSEAFAERKHSEIDLEQRPTD
jgi:hypothetical protein